jgi:hypothetical protein
MSKVLPRTGITISVAKTCFADTVEQYERFDQRMVKHKTGELEKRVDMMQRLATALIELPRLDRLCAVAHSCDDFALYCDILSTLVNRYLVVMAVCDTPGNNISSELMDKLREIGFTDFCRDLWCMYIGVAYKGNVLFQQRGDQEAPLRFNATDFFCDIPLVISSAPWHKGNKAEIVINGTDYAVNKRGLNIVVYDVQEKKLIDSVAFDWHYLACKAFR